MSTIPSGSVDHAVPHRSGPAPAGDAGAAEEVETYHIFDRGGSSAQVDTVEISAAAREMAGYKPYSPMNPKKVLVPDSAEEQKFRELMNSVKSQKSDIMTQIEDAFKKNGISLDDIDKVKIEIDRSGKIVVAGIDDPDKARAIENTLNRDRTLAGKLGRFQRDEAELSRKIMDYTGTTLFELTMTERGDFNERIRETVPDKEDEYYQELRFLGGTLDTVVSRDDIAALGFGRGKIDFSGEVDVNAKPEENIRESIDSLTGKINEAFDANNAELAEQLGVAPVAGPAGAARDNRFLSLANAGITIDNYGKVTVEGLLSADEETHRKGVAIIEELVREMLNETEENSYHLNIFTEAGNVLLRRSADERGLGAIPGGMQSRVLAKIMNGGWGGVDISLP